MSILITTYEGTHDHPLPISATAMASTTSAAASVLQSRSSTSQPGNFMNSSINAPLMPTSSFTPSNSGFNFTSFYNSKTQQQQQQLYFPNTSISTSNSHPTITLDLTVPNSISRIFPSTFSSTPRFSSACDLNFSSSSSFSSSLDFNSLKTPWMSNQSSYFNHGISQQSKNQTGFVNSNGKRPFEEPVGFKMNNASSDQQCLMTETIAAATKAIASNPKFHSALAAALTSVVGKGGSGAVENQGMNFKWGTESLTAHSLFPAAGKN